MREWLSWLWLALWSLVIFATIPLARTLQARVQEHVGREAFLYITLLGIAAALAVALRRARHPVWLGVVAAGYVAYAYALRAAPEEALHFLEYGVLGVLAYRALAHRIHDISVFLAAGLIGAIVGTLDEALQWITPERVWDLRDIWLNFVGASLVQLGIALGLRPPGVSALPRRPSVRILCRLALVTTLLLGASLAVALEYGHLHEDPEIGRFRSRLTLQQLHEADAALSHEAARILNAHRDDAAYARFVQAYPAQQHPFLHEARVHLFRRDRYLQQDPAVAHAENRILEKYFSRTLAASSYVLELPPPPGDYESPVSQNLVTRVSRRQVLASMAGAVLLLILLDRALARRPRPTP
jgi:hypothetical protein